MREEKKKVLEKSYNNKGGGYLDEMDLPPCISDDEGDYGYEDDDEEQGQVQVQEKALTQIAASGVKEKLESDPEKGLKGTGDIENVDAGLVNLSVSIHIFNIARPFKPLLCVRFQFFLYPWCRYLSQCLFLYLYLYLL